MKKSFLFKDSPKLSKGVFEGIKLQNPSLSDGGVRLLMLKGEIAKIRQFGQWEDRWARHPLPTMSELEKAACCLTNSMKIMWTGFTTRPAYTRSMRSSRKCGAGYPTHFFRSKVKKFHSSYIQASSSIFPIA
jgi:hypothetical protein